MAHFLVGEFGEELFFLVEEFVELLFEGFVGSFQLFDSFGEFVGFSGVGFGVLSMGE